MRNIGFPCGPRREEDDRRRAPEGWRRPMLDVRTDAIEAWARVTGLGGGNLQTWLRIEIVKPAARMDVSVIRLSDPPPGRLSPQQELGSLRQRALESNTSAPELEDRRQSR